MVKAVGECAGVCRGCSVPSKLPLMSFANVLRVIQLKNSVRQCSPLVVFSVGARCLLEVAGNDSSQGYKHMFITISDVLQLANYQGSGCSGIRGNKRGPVPHVDSCHAMKPCELRC